MGGIRLVSGSGTMANGLGAALYQVLLREAINDVYQR
jgi:hypothetical protein